MTSIGDGDTIDVRLPGGGGLAVDVGSAVMGPAWAQGASR